MNINYAIGIAVMAVNMNKLLSRTEKQEVVEKLAEIEQLAINGEKQTAKKPDFEGDGYGDNSEINLDTWICPSCEERYKVDYDEYDYCPNCGQRIDRDWSE